MASSHLLCNTFHFQSSCNLSSKSNISSFKPRGPFSFCQQLQFPKTPVVKATGKKVEVCALGLKFFVVCVLGSKF
jgi:4-diphosphocytidyl-2-C-methyl-D-erythritol kinase